MLITLKKMQNLIFFLLETAFGTKLYKISYLQGNLKIMAHQTKN